MQIKDKNFPTDMEIRDSVMDYVKTNFYRGIWPYDDWFTISDNLDVNVWIDIQPNNVFVPMATVYLVDVHSVGISFSFKKEE